VSRRRLIQLAVICAAAAILTALLGTIGSMWTFQMANLRAAPDARFEVQTPGQWVVASQTRAVVDGQSLMGEAITSDRVTVRNPDGVSIQLREPDQAVRYHQADRDGVVIGVFDAMRRGTYLVSIDGGEGILLAVGPDPVGAVSRWVLISGSIAIVLLGVSGCLGWVAFRGWRR